MATTMQILDHTYTLPEIANEQFRQLQEQVHARQRLIREGVKSQSRWWGLIPRAPVALSEEERFRELELLVRDYDTIIAGLKESKDAYEVFFTQLATGVKQAVRRKSDEIRHLEQERTALHQSAVSQQDRALEQWAIQSEEQLRQSVQLLGQAALLLLKKLMLCQEGIKKLAEDQALQQQVLSQLVGQLKTHRRAYFLQKQIDRVIREVAQMAEVALNFEQVMRDHFGPLQGLLEQVVHADESLHKAVAEIEAITGQMLRQSLVPWSSSEAFDLRLLHFLTASTLKRERLTEILERIERQDGTEEALDVELATSGSPAISVQEALNNIELLIDLRLTPLVPDPLLSETAPELPSTSETRDSSVTGLATAVRSKPDPQLPSTSEPLLINSIGTEFVLIPAGTFIMGSELGDARPAHQVTISQPFYLGKFPVTQTQWVAIMQTNPSRYQGEHHPVENVSWEEVQQFIRRLNAKEGSRFYRLPTEAEWEYAARAGSTTAYCFGKNAKQLREYAWYKANSHGKTHPVGQLKPNACGLYDIHGNVWEWVQDWYGTYPTGAVRDPRGASSGSSRVRRGGSWSTGAGSCRVSKRDAVVSSSHLSSLGFRLLRIIS